MDNFNFPFIRKKEKGGILPPLNTAILFFFFKKAGCNTVRSDMGSYGGPDR